MRQRYLWKALILLAIIPILANGQTVYQISDGENKIDSLLFYNVQAGDIIELTSNGGYYYEWFPAEISIPLTIRAKAGLEVKPIWYCDDDAKMIVVYDDLTLEGIRFDGSLGMNPTDRCLITDSTGTGTGTKLDYHLTIENCEFVNFDRVIYGQPYTQADTVSISNAWFAHIGERAIYYKDPELDPGSVKHFFLENSTFWDIGEDVIYVGDHDADSETPGPEFVVDHVTIHDPGMADAGIKTIYPKYLD
ncbi:MAG: hypothetical protein HQ510_02990, partial [Candidatus Marinimicrobia bacterium]|nr:hypothetical protein [Candidatus Neomarinimicrobiota bacterium]